MADIKKIILPDASEYNIRDARLTDALSTKLSRICNISSVAYNESQTKALPANTWTSVLNLTGLDSSSGYLFVIGFNVSHDTNGSGIVCARLNAHNAAGTATPIRASHFYNTGMTSHNFGFAWLHDGSSRYSLELISEIAGKSNYGRIYAIRLN